HTLFAAPDPPAKSTSPTAPSSRSRRGSEPAIASPTNPPTRSPRGGRPLSSLGWPGASTSIEVAVGQALEPRRAGRPGAARRGGGHVGPAPSQQARPRPTPPPVYAARPRPSTP